MNDPNDDVNTKIFHAIADVFQRAQSTYAGHRKHVAVLKKIQSKAVAQGYESAFNYWFKSLVTKLLPLKKNEIVGDRIVKLVAAFVASLDREIQLTRKEDVDPDPEYEEVFSRFVDQFIRHILRGVECKDRNVRYRVVQLLAVIMDNIGELDESLYNLLMWSLNKRIYDKEANVRIQAVFCLTKFQEDEAAEKGDIADATRTLMVVIQNDPSAEVRRAAMLNLTNNSATRAYILERARDVNQVNRRLVYTRILRSMGEQCFDQVDSRILDQLLEWGLEDREDSVRKSCSKLISHDWLNLLGGDLIEFLEKLNVTKSSVATKAMGCLFQTRPDIISKVRFPEDIWKEFTVEIAFLLRCFYIHCAENNLQEAIEQNFPEASKLSEYLNSYVQQRFIDVSSSFSKADKHSLEFIIEQLLIVANRYDFSDEIGRRAMLTVVRNMLGIFKLSEPLIEIGLQVLKSLSINERDFVTMVIEIINDIRDDDIEEQEKDDRLTGGVNDYADDGGNDDDDDADDADDADLDDGDGGDDDGMASFHKTTENTVGGRASPGEDIMKHLPPQKELRSETVVACLTRSSHMLALVNMSLEQNILITSLIDTLITPAVRNTDSKIRELGVRNLGLCCLLDLQLATENMYILGMCVSKGNASLKQIALKVIVDIFSVHGISVVDGEGKVDSISLHKIFYKVLKNDDLPECQVVAAEGLCKLFLADVFVDDDLFETLVLSYFSPANSSNEPLIQAFAFCIPVYCFSHTNHQQRMTRIAADVLLRLCMLWDDLQLSEEPDVDREAMLKPNVIFQQLLHWTDPRKLINQPEEAARKDSVQLGFLLDVTKIFGRIEKKEIKKMLLINLNAAFITADHDYEKLKQIAEHVEDIIENEVLDSVSMNALEKFKNTLVHVLDEAYEKSLHQTNEASDNDDEQYSIILESANTEEDADPKSEGNIDKSSMDSTGEISKEQTETAIAATTRKRYRTECDDELSTKAISPRESLVNPAAINSHDKLNDNPKNVSFILPQSSGDSDGDISISSEDDSYVDN